MSEESEAREESIVLFLGWLRKKYTLYETKQKEENVIELLQVQKTDLELVYEYWNWLFGRKTNLAIKNAETK